MIGQATHCLREELLNESFFCFTTIVLVEAAVCLTVEDHYESVWHPGDDDASKPTDINWADGHNTVDEYFFDSEFHQLIKHMYSFYGRISNYVVL